jgi:hypothetical protein
MAKKKVTKKTTRKKAPNFPPKLKGIQGTTIRGVDFSPIDLGLSGMDRDPEEWEKGG